MSVQTWEAYAALAEKHNGVWGGCFCTWFHPRRKDEGRADVVEAGRPYKELLVREGRALLLMAAGRKESSASKS